MTHSRQARTPRIAGILALGVPAFVVAAIALGHGLPAAPTSSADPPPAVVLPTHHHVGHERARALRRTLAWPADGQAAVIVSGQLRIHAGPGQHAAPIASVAKVMTAYLVLRDHPLQPGEDGPAITLTAADVADTTRRAIQGESVVPVAAGEQLSERQALEALLIPSANNIAAVLAQWDAGSEERFVASMNAAARSLGMTHTRYTDPSGFDDATVSTAADQVRIVMRAMRIPAFTAIVAMPSVVLPFAGAVRNTDTLLGEDGFVGVKTGSDDAAGGCFAFRAIRRIDGRLRTITGVVLGQPGDDPIAAGLDAADAMVRRIAGERPRLDDRRMPAPTLGAP